MANICDGYMHDKEGNLYRPHSNSKTSDYSSEKTSVDNTSDALDELYEKVENANSGIELTYAEYLALSEEEKSNGTTYYVKDYPVSANGEIPIVTSEIDGLMAKEDKIKLDSLILVNGVIDSSNLPSYVDDIIEGYYSDGVLYEDSECTIEIKGESGKIYVDLTEEDKPKTYRWSGSIYVEISGGSGANSDLGAKVNVTTESEDLFNTVIVFSIEGGETVTGTIDSTGKCSVTLKYGGVYTITMVDGGTSTVEVTFGNIYSVTVTALPKTVITVTTEDFAGKTVTVTGPEESTLVFDTDGKITLVVRTIGTYTLTCEGYTKKINVTELDTTMEATFNQAIIYAFHIDDSESDPASAVTYLEDAEGLTPAHMDYSSGTFNYGSWENAFFMPRPCMLKYDGTVDYYLDDNDYTKKEDGTTASDVASTSYGGNAMMEWGRDDKKIWVKVDTTSDGCSSTSPTIYISDTQVDETYKAYSFINNQGNLVEHFYTPIYNGSNISNKLRSISGQTCSVSTTADTEITYAKANNTGSDVLWYTETFSDRCLINYLLILMGRSLDTQTTFGYGYANGNSAQISTGTMNTKGLFWGESTGKYGVKVFGMENWWGNIWRRIAGLINIENGTTGAVKSKMTYGTQDGSTANGYNLTGDGYNTTGVVVTENKAAVYTKATFSDNGMVPSEWNNGSTSTNYCDYGYVYATRNQIDIAYVGGNWNNSLSAGAFCVYLYSAASISATSFGASISCKPLS